MSIFMIALALGLGAAVGIFIGVAIRDRIRMDSADISYLALRCAEEEPLSIQTKAVVEEAMGFYERLQ